MATFDDDNIGGKEYGTVYWGFGGDKERARELTGLGRKFLGEMKNRMRLGELPSLSHKVTLQDGTVFMLHSNQHGSAPIDKVGIYVPPVNPRGSKKDMITGFIVRITSAEKLHLVLNVKEPVEPDKTDGYGIQTEYWHDTALTDEENGYNTYDAYVVDFPAYPDNLLYGFEWSFDDYSTLTTPTNAQDTGYRTDERGPNASTSKTNLSWIWPGAYTHTDAFIANAQYAWYGQLWSIDGFGVPVAPLEDPQWGGYQSIIDATFSIPALDGGSPTTYNTNLAAAISAYATGSTASVKGLAITASLQKTDNPVTRFFNSNYALDNGVISVKAINDDPEFHAFAVVRPGAQRYVVPEQYRDMVKENEMITHHWSYTNPFSGTTPFIPISGQTGDPSLPPNTILAMGHSFGNSATIDTSLIPPVTHIYNVPIESTLTETVTDEYVIPEWTMVSEVKGGEYEIDVKVWWGENLSTRTDLTFDVDIVLMGSQYPPFKYRDEISLTPDANFDHVSKKLCTIRLLNEVDYDPHKPNPNIQIKDRP